jgi:hypothetical protein
MLDGVGRAVEPVLAGDDRRDLSGLGVFGDIGLRVGGDDQDARRFVGVVSDLVASFRAAWQRHDVAFRELAIAVVQAHRGSSAEHDQLLFGPVVEVIDELPRAGLELPERGTEGSSLGPDDPPRPDAATPVGDVFPDIAGVVLLRQRFPPSQRERRSRSGAFSGRNVVTGGASWNGASAAAAAEAIFNVTSPG